MASGLALDSSNPIGKSQIVNSVRDGDSWSVDTACVSEDKFTMLERAWIELIPSKDKSAASI